MTIIRGARIRCLIWLLCSAILAGLGFWYPSYVLARHGGPDDRGGAVFMAGTPFYFIGAAIAVVAFIALLDAARREKMPKLYFARFIGALLALISLSPLVLIAQRLLGR